MKSRQRMWAGCIAVGYLFLLVGLTRVGAAEDVSLARPNIIFLLADDMGYGDLGCFGSPIIKSPNLDRLAQQGMKLNQCYAASPNCSPARTGILTGRHPYRVGMYDFARFKPLHIPVEETTVAEQLKSAGYSTMFAGKWHCSGDFESGKQPYPGDHGFDHWLAHKGNFGKSPEGFLRNGKQAGQLQGWMSEIVVDETINWLDQQDRSTPFFTCLWFSEPHTPVLAADEFRDLYPEEKIASQVKMLAKSGGPQVIRKRLQNPDLYFGCVSMLDHHIGRLMKYLKHNKLDENTIIVFTSDNGPEHRTPTAFGSSGHLRGAKGHIHDGGIHVPGIVRWPGKIQPGSVSDEPVNGTDWLPTFSAAAGVKLPNRRPIDGANVLPAFLDGTPVERPQPMLWWLWHARGGFEVAMRDGDYKLLATMTPQADPGNIADAKPPMGWTIMEFIKKAKLDRFEMFNLMTDPSETSNLVPVEPKRFEELRKRMIALHAEVRAEGPEYSLGRSKAR
ncbi:MAG: sulfatase family protein [Rubripirellula sp.]